ncbi:hypothetical protein PGT21_013075 [Puccinia graminis f. sp. tritici]|uniref:Uncharacterized protein n=1 Tax=Puccinia graminis f. sp. tritici TaxID=56615 RepID=A0A5B0NMD6_PUCGR|nr:hypothetical protein PGT21_013075 [Puccinia graminis f. sp. tritici]
MAGRFKLTNPVHINKSFYSAKAGTVGLNRKGTDRFSPDHICSRWLEWNSAGAPSVELWMPSWLEICTCKSSWLNEGERNSGWSVKTNHRSTHNSWLRFFSHQLAQIHRAIANLSQVSGCGGRIWQRSAGQAVPEGNSPQGRLGPEVDKLRDAWVSFEETIKMLQSLEEAVLRRREILGSQRSSLEL